MKKFQVSASFFILVALCLVTKNFLILINYFCALILHELAHFFVASSKGYKLKQARLSMCGLIINLDEEVEDKDKFIINIAGPSFNILLAVCCMAMYWLVPKSYYYLNNFCLANLALAVFNLIPIYPLDGGKIVHSMFKNKKHFNVFNNILRFSLIGLFIILFICSVFTVTNYFYLIWVIFFIALKEDKKPSFSIFKHNKKRRIEKVVLLKVNSNLTLFELIKKLNNRYYTIFYCHNSIKPYLDEDMLIDLSAKYQLTQTLSEIYK